MPGTEVKRLGHRWLCTTPATTAVTTDEPWGVDDGVAPPDAREAPSAERGPYEPWAWAPGGVRAVDRGGRCSERRSPVAWLRISDKAAGGPLAFDLWHVLRALGPDAPGWTWTVSAVEETGEELWATGEGAVDLEALERSGEPVAGSRLIRIAERVPQVVWGEFRAHRDPTSTGPFVRVVAFDGTCFEVWCDDDDVIDRLRAAFKDTGLIAPPMP